MKKRLPVVAALALLAFSPCLIAADVKVELGDLVDKINAKIQDGTPTEENFASELKAFDELVARHKDEKTDEVAQVLMMKATLYIEAFHDTTKAIDTIKAIKAQFPDSPPGKQADATIALLTKDLEKEKIQNNLKPGTPFPDFTGKDLDGKPLALSKYKGKLVMIDFWATWCGPCIAELPNVLKVYEKYHAKGFSVIGISLDQDKDRLASFIKERNIPWPQCFDGQAWESKLAVKYGISTIPATYLLDKKGKIIAKNLRGEELEAAVGKALGAR